MIINWVINYQWWWWSIEVTVNLKVLKRLHGDIRYCEALVKQEDVVTEDNARESLVLSKAFLKLCILTLLYFHIHVSALTSEKWPHESRVEKVRWKRSRRRRRSIMGRRGRSIRGRRRGWFNSQRLSSSSVLHLLVQLWSCFCCSSCCSRPLWVTFGFFFCFSLIRSECAALWLIRLRQVKVTWQLKHVINPLKETNNQLNLNTCCRYKFCFVFGSDRFLN